MGMNVSGSFIYRHNLLILCGIDCGNLPIEGKDETNEIEMTIPGLDWGMEEVMQKDQKKVPQKKVPYAKPIPAQFQQVSNSI